MFRVTGKRVTAILTALTISATALGAPVPGQTGDQEKEPAPAAKVKKQLDQLVSLESTDQSLNAVLARIHEQTKINFVVDRLALQQLGQDPEQMPTNVKVQDVKARSCLRSVLTPHNLGYAIIGDTVLISADEIAISKQMRQRVSIDFDKMQLAAALNKLARDTATNVLVDSRVAQKEGMAAVTLQIEDVPLETAVRLISEMAGLKPVRVGNVLFVTTKARAAEMRADPDLNPNPGGNPQVTPFDSTIVPLGIVQPGVVPGAAPAVVNPPPPPVEKTGEDKPSDKVEKSTEKDEPAKPAEKADSKPAGPAKPEKP